MQQYEIEAAIERYNRRLSEYGATEKALGWGVKGRSRIRFRILLSRWNFNGASVLDFGCGFGDLYGYMSEQGVRDFHYVGLDINPALIEVGKERYPQAEFVVADASGDRLDGRTFDFVLSSGAFNFKLEDNRHFIETTLARFNALAAKGFASNFLSSRVDYELDHAYHADPLGILSLAYRYSNNIVLRNDYMPFEFTIFVDKASKIDPEFTVYEDYVKFR